MRLISHKLYILNQAGHHWDMHADAFWSYFAMPIGVTICFGPAIVVGLLFNRDKSPDSDEAPRKH